MPAFYEFFAGGGMARAGLGDQWHCLFANDFDAKKSASYAANWGVDHLKVADVETLQTADLPPKADLAWASFPCQDLSLAGDHAGLKGNRSGTFWPFWRLITSLARENRAPELIVLENVCGALTSHEGKDFAAIGTALAKAGYRFGAIVADAVHFVPQSRPRLFIVAVKNQAVSALTGVTHDPHWHPANLVEAWKRLPQATRQAWLWWSLPQPPARRAKLVDLLEDPPQGVKWRTAAETRRLLSMMSKINREKVEKAKRAGHRVAGGVYKRTRVDEKGNRVQRAEVRFDDIAGCLRTPVGGSSRQTILIVEGGKVRSRLLAPREAARLMGLPETYTLPSNYNDAYYLAGDGVAVPVVRFLAEHLLNPLAAASQT